MTSDRIGVDSGLVEPQTVGKYKILGKIGQGAMGVVYQARDPVLDRLVAIKIIAADQTRGWGESSAERFRREARLAASLNHPNIVTVYDFGEEQNLFYMAMEFLEGADLAQVLHRNELPRLEDKLKVMEQVAEGVALAHSKGLIHRDLKPANVHLLPSGQAKILDFGLARSGDPQLTRMGEVVGTPQYMSPEQVQGQPADARSDVFAMGAVFYEVLTGRKCFPAKSTYSILFQVMEREPQPLKTLDRNIPGILDQTIRRALAKKAEERFQDGEELLLALNWVKEVVAGQRSEKEAMAALSLANAEPPGARLFTAPPKAPEAPEAQLDPGAAVGSQDTLGLVADDLGRPQSVGRGGPPSVGRGGPPSVGRGRPPSVGRGRPPSVVDSSAGAATDTVASQARVTFRDETGGDRSFVVGKPSEESLLELSLMADIPHFHECGGQARCSTCRVRVLAGREGLTPLAAAESKLLRRLGCGDDTRLACQARVTGDVVVERLIRDTEDFGLLRFESADAALDETALVILSCRIQFPREFVRRSAPYDVVHVLNRFFLRVGEPILASGGAIESYTGDGLVAHFGLREGKARDKCLSAIRAGLRIVARMKELNRYTRTNFNVELKTRIGLHFGRAILAQVGHPSVRQITTIGTVAPTATWLAALDAPGESPILVSEDILNIVEDDVRVGEGFHTQGPDGRETGVYELLDFRKPDAVLIVQLSFEEVARRGAQAATLFYRLLFEIDPAVEALFAGVDMEAQKRKFLEMLTTVVNGLDGLEEIRSVVEELGRRHTTYGVRLEHYDLVEQCLLETFRQMLGDSFTVDVRLAWSQIYNQLVRIMINTPPEPA